jgi:intracellular sulfur oxidation DsrE/DsrF family protein
MVRKILPVLAAVIFMAFSNIASADDKVHRLVLQISDDSKQKMNTVLNVAANISRYYSAKGEEIEIEVVAFNKGLHMLRTDTSPVTKRITNFSQSMANVTFLACGNTMKGMAKKEGKMPEIMSFAEQVPAGVVQILERNEEGWTVIRP